MRQAHKIPHVLTGSRLSQAKVLEVSSPGELLVALEGSAEALRCCLLHELLLVTPPLAPGDVVLIAVFDQTASSGVVLGRLAPPVDAAPRREPPDELVIEAKKGLVLRVGEGSITIRADGKILIKGKDLVSHAKRMNRIKGGSVSLN